MKHQWAANQTELARQEVVPTLNHQVSARSRIKPKRLQMFQHLHKTKIAHVFEDIPEIGTINSSS